MKYTLLLSLMFLFVCKNKDQMKTTESDTSISTLDMVQDIKEVENATPTFKTYANERFKDVYVEKIGQDSFLVRGQGQIFEANFNWVVEDGHDELKKGYHMTDAGAPEWGKFELPIHIQKERSHSTLMLILFESSAKDGSRQHQLLIALPD